MPGPAGEGNGALDVLVLVYGEERIWRGINNEDEIKGGVSIRDMYMEYEKRGGQFFFFLSYICLPCMLSISKYGLSPLINRASCTVCTVALLPEPWKARSVGLMVAPEWCEGGLGVMNVEGSCVVMVLSRLCPSLLLCPFFLSDGIRLRRWAGMSLCLCLRLRLCMCLYV